MKEGRCFPTCTRVRGYNTSEHACQSPTRGSRSEDEDVVTKKGRVCF